METLRAGDASVTIDHDHGARLVSLQIGGHELLRTPDDAGDSPHSWGSFPMVPFAGRIRDARFGFEGASVELTADHPPHAIHGTVADARFQAVAPGVSVADFGPEWPWPGRVTQTVELDDHRLSQTLTVEADAPMPVSAGWHPWFRRRVGGADVVLTVPAERMWRRDPSGVPDGTLVEPPPGPWDDCFTALVGPVQLAWPGVLTLWIESDCEHVVVYDEPDDHVCVEPQSAPPDAHNSGEDLVVVEPDAPWSVTTTWTWQPST